VPILLPNLTPCLVTLARGNTNKIHQVIQIQKLVMRTYYSCTCVHMTIQTGRHVYKGHLPHSSVQKTCKSVKIFLRSSGSGTGSTQPREDNWGATWMERRGSGTRKSRLTAVEIRCADHATPSIRKSWH
jgi:hypothetical protein